jgi:hypothetical protein
MDKHKRLKIIIDKIWYKNNDLLYNDYSWCFIESDWDWWFDKVNIRTIIFTNNFMEALAKSYKHNIPWWKFMSNELNIKALINYNNPIVRIEDLLDINSYD